jgi:hypothetical protein
MKRVNRREFLKISGGSILAVTAGCEAALAQINAMKEVSVEEWMDAWMSATRAPEGTLHVSRFVEPIYFLTQPIGWKPDPGQEAKFRAVQVPRGFVTDFASIPRLFWNLLRPDGEYTYPAIIHDFLYWTQTEPRDVADEILKIGMEEFSIDAVTIALIYNAVHLGGATAWNSNAQLKAQGEKRVLRRFPTDPRVRWADWKKLPDVFATQARKEKDAG